MMEVVKRENVDVCVVSHRCRDTSVVPCYIIKRLLLTTRVFFIMYVLDRTPGGGEGRGGRNLTLGVTQLEV